MSVMPIDRYDWKEHEPLSGYYDEYLKQRADEEVVETASSIVIAFVLIFLICIPCMLLKELF